ncbi:MAG: hypothetical protein Q9216_004895 [Gyalolechia sp. 2 TL-2023]
MANLRKASLHLGYRTAVAPANPVTSIPPAQSHQAFMWIAASEVVYEHTLDDALTRIDAEMILGSEEMTEITRDPVRVPVAVISFDCFLSSGARPTYRPATPHPSNGHPT